MSEIQKNLLGLLLDKFEKSKRFYKENKVNQSFSCRPVDIYADYDSDYTSVDDIHEFEQEMLELEQAELVSVVWEKSRKRSVIIKITAKLDKIGDYYLLLDRVDKNTLKNNTVAVLEKHLDTVPITTAFCKAQIDRLNDRKKLDFTVSDEELEKLLHCLRYIENNDTEIMERELSIEIFHDSKAFEKHYKSRICKIISKYSETAHYDDEVILPQYQVVQNPSYIYVKGNGCIKYCDGYEIQLNEDHPVAICSKDIEKITSIDTSANEAVTIENLTSFNRTSPSRRFLVYLSGYNNSVKSKFLSKLHSSGKIGEWYHFGDIDPDGFFILKHLCDDSGIEFQPLFMTVEELKKYSDYCKPLEKNDIVKANSLINIGYYSDVAKYMLDNNCKLEQEIISWKMR